MYAGLAWGGHVFLQEPAAIVRNFEPVLLAVGANLRAESAGEDTVGSAAFSASPSTAAIEGAPRSSSGG